MRKLWLEKLPGTRAEAIICRSHSVRVALDRSTVLKQEERARRIAPQREISHQCRESAEWQMAGTNVDVKTLPKWVSLGALHVNSHAGWTDHGVHANILDTKME